MGFRKGPPVWTRNRRSGEIKQIERKKARDDPAWARIVLGEVEKYGGEGSLMVMVARMVEPGMKPMLKVAPVEKAGQMSLFVE